MKPCHSIIVCFVLITITVISTDAKPAARNNKNVKSISNYRCVKARQCGNPILPNPSRPEDQVFTPDLAVYDGNGYPIWTLSFCKNICGNEKLLGEIIQEAADSGVRSENFGDTNVCCRESDLDTDARNSINWSLTKDPKRCDEFKKDGYKCVPEAKCINGGYVEEENNVDQDLKCDLPVDLRTFIEDERKKSNGNVCCRIATINLQSDDDVIRSDQNAELEATFETRVCNQRPGYRCVESSKCNNHKHRDFAEAIDERRGAGNVDDWEATAVCDAPQDENAEDAFIRSDSGDGEKVCCKEEHIKKKPSCSTISDTHRCVPRNRCSPTRRRQEDIEVSTDVRSNSDEPEIFPEDYQCNAADFVRSSKIEIDSDTENLGERTDYDYDRTDYSAETYEDYNSEFGNRQTEEEEYGGAIDYYDYESDENSDYDNELTCCLHSEILPDVVKEEGIEKCSDKFGFRCVRQDTCRNSEVLVSEDTSEADSKLIHLGIRIDTFNQTILFQKGNLCGSVLEVCCNVNKVPESLQQEILTPPPDYKSKCGTRNIKGVDVTVDGKEDGKQLTQFGEWPNMCAISMKNPRNNRQIYLGGASLITSGIVVTAAHKVLERPAEDLTVRCGDWDARNINEPRPYQDRSVQSVSIHPSFDSVNVYNDVALLHVEEPFQLDQHIDRICLPPPNDRFSYQSRGCKATGWGKDKYEGGSYQVLMAQVELPLVDNRKCQANLREFTELSDSFKLHDSFLCAGGEAGVDTCVGDGGGPLMCPSATDPDKWIQAGITAWGIGCGKENVPGVYASLTESVCFIDWATKCKHGDKYIDDFDFGKECNNRKGSWIDQEIIRLEKDLDKVEFHLERSSLSKIQRKRYTKKRNNLRLFLERAEEMQAECSSSIERGESFNPDDFDDDTLIRGDEEEEYYDYYDDESEASRD